MSEYDQAVREVDSAVDRIAAGLVRKGVPAWDAMAQAQRIYRNRQRYVPDEKPPLADQLRRIKELSKS